MGIRRHTVLVLQGGGALGAYQAGASAAMAAGGLEPGWVAGISIGAINAAILCGNPRERRTERLRAFWHGVTSALPAPVVPLPVGRRSYAKLSAASAASLGVPGFFRPWAMSFLMPWVAAQTVSVYDTAPLRDTLTELVDFDYLNDKGPRLSVGAVDVETGNFTYFDSSRQTIAPEHIMASGALPPGFAPVEIDGRLYWDGGLVSNTPLQYVMENGGDDPLEIFQIDLFAARGAAPKSIADTMEREKDIRYSSRTRLTTDRYRQLHDMRAAADRLAARLPKALQDDPDLALLRSAGPGGPISLVHLIYRRADFETDAKDYEFSRLSMLEHWASGERDVRATLRHPAWVGRDPDRDGLQVFDLAGEDAPATEKRRIVARAEKSPPPKRRRASA